MSKHTQEVINFYNNIYLKKQAAAMRPLATYVPFVKILNPLANKKILDVACGTGFLLKLLAEKNLETYGVDISPEAVVVAKKESPTSKIFVASAENLPFNADFFDYVTCIGSIEHFENLDKGLTEILRVAKKEAKFVFVVPNKDYFFWYFKSKKGTHQRDIGEELKSLKDWQKFFQKHQLKIVKTKVDRYPTTSLPWFYSFNPYKILKRLFFKIVWLFLPKKYTYQFIFLIQHQ